MEADLWWVFGVIGLMLAAACALVRMDRKITDEELRDFLNKQYARNKEKAQ